MDARVSDAISPVQDAVLEAQGVDETVGLMVDGKLAARCSCWWTDTPMLDGERLGVIGHYAALNASAGAAVLEDACELLAKRGLRRAVGPMDGSTWRRYRFIVDRGPEPIFFFEPDNPDGWPEHWMAAGFEPLATYSSAVNDSPGLHDPRTDVAVDRLGAQGVRIRSLEVAAAQTELKRIYDLSLSAFADNFLYTPIGEREFLAQYEAVLPFVQPDLVLLAEREDTLVGYMFALPDLLETRRAGSSNTVVLKTLAVDPSMRGAGLGGALLDLAQRSAHRCGYRRVIHALIHESNQSGRISARYARTIRRYVLFARTIGA